MCRAFRLERCPEVQPLYQGRAAGSVRGRVFRSLVIPSRCRSRTLETKRKATARPVIDCHTRGKTSRIVPSRVQGTHRGTFPTVFKCSHLSVRRLRGDARARRGDGRNNVHVLRLDPGRCRSCGSVDRPGRTVSNSTTSRAGPAARALDGVRLGARGAAPGRPSTHRARPGASGGARTLSCVPRDGTRPVAGTGGAALQPDRDRGDARRQTAYERGLGDRVVSTARNAGRRARGAGLTSTEVRGLLPFDPGRARAFDPYLVAGWDAELPTRSRAEVDRAAVGEIRELEARRLRKWLLPGDAHEVESLHTDVTLHGVDLVLFPVWLATYRQGERVYRLLVNGQTGRCCGRPPISWVKVSLAMAGVALVILAVLWATGVLR
jgi:hypothetical protein